MMPTHHHQRNTLSLLSTTPFRLSTYLILCTMIMTLLSQLTLQQQHLLWQWKWPIAMVNAFSTSSSLSFHVSLPRPQPHQQRQMSGGGISCHNMRTGDQTQQCLLHSVRRKTTTTGRTTRCYQSGSTSSSDNIDPTPNAAASEAATATAATATMENNAIAKTPADVKEINDGEKGDGTKPKGPKIRRILSGVQPTGSLHLGNYFGAIQQWVQFQNTHCPIIDCDAANTDYANNTTTVENYFCVVDLHAITSTQPQSPQELYQSSLMSVALYIAAGIDPQRSKIFIQSHVKAHTELAWLLQCMTPINWIERMIQYKEKAKKMQDNSVSTGLMTYPVLMAADILLYQATEVPVGEDQRQHLELTRDIVRRFHDIYCNGNAYKKRMKSYNLPTYPVFTEPTAMIASTTVGTSRIMSLTDGTNKMSKSDSNDYSRINLLDPPELIRDKIKRCKTDAEVGIEWDNPERPEATNLLNVYAAVQPNRSRDDIMNEVKEMTWGTFKPLLADAIIDHLLPIQTKYHEIMKSNDKGKSSNSIMVEENEYLSQVLKDGAASANMIASQTLHRVKVAMGFVIPKEV